MMKSPNSTRERQFGSGRSVRALRKATEFWRWLATPESLPSVTESGSPAEPSVQRKGVMWWFLSAERLPVTGPDSQASDRSPTPSFGWLIERESLPDISSIESSGPNSAGYRRSLLRWLLAGESVDSVTPTTRRATAEEE